MLHPDGFWTRRDFLRLAGQAGFLSAFPTLASAAAALESDTVCISILHTTDLHGHILPTADYNGTPDYGGLARCGADSAMATAKFEFDFDRRGRRLSGDGRQFAQQGRADDRSL